ncbi:hypothetical protein [Mesoplasma tabanidae]|uniref:Lipoprotein-associated type-17 domain-containing protein n=1 Tax=Mesoplasma tabanidae TaxID=219745 RepID=A0A2K8P815_9MOLU|nr:hypothetical protein [Mesoplasma tabanidae]ATZ21745.1 hypothetical protein MTABA_v1c05510 [Mesoplasma tabanidae]
MKKTITLLAAVSIVGGASTTAVSCSFKGDKNKGGTTNPKPADKETSQVLLKAEIQKYLNEKGTFNSKEDAITDIQNKSDWTTEGLESLVGSIYGSDSVSSIHIKAKLKEGYVWPKTSSGEFDVIIKIDNENNVNKLAEELSTTYYKSEEEAKETIKSKFKSISGVDQVVVAKIANARSQLKYEVNLTYKNNVQGPEKKDVLINIKNNLSTDIYAANQSISKDNKKYESKVLAAKIIKETFESIKGVKSTNLVWDQWAPYNYTISIKYDDKSQGPETAEGVIQLKTNLSDAIKTAKNIFEIKEYKNSVSAKSAVETNLKIEGILNAEFSWEDEATFKYNIKFSYSNDFFGPPSISGTLLKYESATFDKIENQWIDMRKNQTISVDLKGKNLANKKISVSSDNSSITAKYADEKIVLTANDNKNIQAVIKVWDEEEKDDGIEFTTSILAKPEIATKLESEYGWYLNHETTLDISTKDFDKVKGDTFVITSQLQGNENSFPVSTYIETSLMQDSQDQQKFIFHYKFIKALPENVKVQIGLKLNGEIVSIFNLVSKSETNISEHINKTLNNIKNNYNWKEGKEDDLQNQVQNDLATINGIDQIYFEWVKKENLSYKVALTYKIGFTGEKSFINNGTWYMPAEFEQNQSLTFDMRNPSNNSYKIYGQNLSGKNFGVETDNSDIKVEIDGQVGVEGNRQYVIIKISTTAKDDVKNKITLYQDDDKNQKVEIGANVWALPYLEKIGDWPTKKLELYVSGATFRYKFIIHNYKKDLDSSIVSATSSDRESNTEEKINVFIEEVSINDGIFNWVIEPKIKNKLFGSQYAILRFKYGNAIQETKVNTWVGA